MKVYQYLPAFYDERIERAVAEASSLEELRAIPWIGGWGDGGNILMLGTDYAPKQWLLMSVTPDGAHWYVIAIVREGLPEWMKALPVWESKGKKPSHA